ncbi:MAG: hypothetical protein II826_03870 [Prevotella sp.]|nr:hypothetical protein [Prevotella sp.]
MSDEHSETVPAGPAAQTIPIGQGRACTLSGAQATDSTHGIVVTDRQKVVRK